MTDVASLQFNIDSSQASRANQDLNSLADTSDKVSQRSAMMTQRFIENTQGLGNLHLALNQMNPALSQTTTSLDMMLQRMDMLRSSMATGGAFSAFRDATLQVDALGRTFGQTSSAIEMYTQKATQLNMTSDQTVRSLQRITEAIQNQTAAGHIMTQMMSGLGMNVGSFNPSQAPQVLQQFIEKLRTFGDDPRKYAFAQSVLGPLDADTYQGLMTPKYVPFAQLQQRQAQTNISQAVSQSGDWGARLSFQNQQEQQKYDDLSKIYNMGIDGVGGWGNFTAGAISGGAIGGGIGAFGGGIGFGIGSGAGALIGGLSQGNPFVGLTRDQITKISKELNLPDNANWTQEGQSQIMQYLQAHPGFAPNAMNWGPRLNQAFNDPNGSLGWVGTEATYRDTPGAFEQTQNNVYEALQYERARNPYSITPFLNSMRRTFVGGFRPLNEADYGNIPPQNPMPDNIAIGGEGATYGESGVVLKDNRTAWADRNQPDSKETQDAIAMQSKLQDVIGEGPGKVRDMTTALQTWYAVLANSDWMTASKAEMEVFKVLQEQQTTAVKQNIEALREQNDQQSKVNSAIAGAGGSVEARALAATTQGTENTIQNAKLQYPLVYNNPNNPSGSVAAQTALRGQTNDNIVNRTTEFDDNQRNQAQQELEIQQKLLSVAGERSTVQEKMASDAQIDASFERQKGELRSTNDQKAIDALDTQIAKIKQIKDETREDITLRIVTQTSLDAARAGITSMQLAGVSPGNRPAAMELLPQLTGPGGAFNDKAPNYSSTDGIQKIAGRPTSEWVEKYLTNPHDPEIQSKLTHPEQDQLAAEVMKRNADQQLGGAEAARNATQAGAIASQRRIVISGGNVPQQRITAIGAGVPAGASDAQRVEAGSQVATVQQGVLLSQSQTLHDSQISSSNSLQMAAAFQDGSVAAEQLRVHLQAVSEAYKGIIADTDSSKFVREQQIFTENISNMTSSLQEQAKTARETAQENNILADAWKRGATSAAQAQITINAVPYQQKIDAAQDSADAPSIAAANRGMADFMRGQNANLASNQAVSAQEFIRNSRNQTEVSQAEIGAGIFASPQRIGTARAGALSNIATTQTYAAAVQNDPTLAGQIQQTFLTQEQTQQQLQQIQQIRQGFNEVGEAAKSAFENAVVGGASLHNVLVGLGQDIEKTILRTMVEQPFQRMVSNLGSDALSSVGNAIFGNGKSAGPSNNTTGPQINGQGSGNSGANLSTGSGLLQTASGGISSALESGAEKSAFSAVGGGISDMFKGAIGDIGTFFSTMFASGGFMQGNTQSQVINTPTYMPNQADFDYGMSPVPPSSTTETIHPMASGGFITRPTYYRNSSSSRFHMAASGTVLAGEVGPEVILPIKRGADGNLGVASTGSGGGVPMIAIHAPININGSSVGSNGIDQGTLLQMQKQLSQQLKLSVKSVIADEMRPGGSLYTSASSM